MLLADMGADVIKIESLPGGDTIRTQGAMRDGLSYYFATFNRNKKSITLNLKAPEGRELFERLVVDADVVVDNFRPGVLDRLGLSRAHLRTLKPDLICASISGFGESGPYRDRPAFDFVAQAMSGFMSVNGHEGEPPLRSGLPISDLVAGLYAALGITAAVVRRGRTGKGDDVGSSLTSGLISFLSYAAANVFAHGSNLPRTGNDHPISAPYGLFRTADGVIAIAPSDDVFFRRLMGALDLEHVVDSPDYASNRERVQHRSALTALLETRLAEANSDHWIELLNQAGVPCGPVYSVDQVFQDPQFMAQEMAIDVDHPGYGNVRMLGFPIKFADSPCTIRHPTPQLGEHTRELLEEIGVSPGRFEELRQLGVI
jgi:crotonobetainyl-CoA:carnitine CoA-transferase CaiB-like acyl-CoA transferase